MTLCAVNAELVPVRSRSTWAVGLMDIPVPPPPWLSVPYLTLMFSSIGDVLATDVPAAGPTSADLPSIGASSLPMPLESTFPSGDISRLTLTRMGEPWGSNVFTSCWTTVAGAMLVLVEEGLLHSLLISLMAGA